MATPPVIAPKYTRRAVDHDVLTLSHVSFCAASTTVDGVAVSATSLPDYADAAEAWRDIGRASNMTPNKESKTLEVIEGTPTGAWMKHKESINQSFSLSWVSSMLSPEALQLAFGIAGPIEDDKPMQLAAAGSNGIEGWLRIEVKKSQDGTDKIKELYAWGRLTLKTAPTIQDDFVKPEFEFFVDPGVLLATVTFAGVQAASTPA